MNIYRFNNFIADYLDAYAERTGDWEGAEQIGERIRKELHSLINSDLAEEVGLFEEVIK